MDEEPVIPIPGRPRPAARGYQFIDYIFWLIYTLLFVRLLLVFVDARTMTGFVRFINGVTEPLYAPFRGITSSPSVNADGSGNVIATPILIAIVAYALLHLAIHKLLVMIAYRRSRV